MEIHANLMHNIITKRFLKRSSVVNTVILIFVFAFSIAFILLRNKNISGNLICLGITLAWVFVGIILFYIDVVFDIMPIVFLLPNNWAITR